MSKSGAKMLFIIGTIIVTIVFLWLTIDTLSKVKSRTKEENLSMQVVEGKKTWQKYNCNDCHTILGIGGYYAPDVTKVAQYRDTDWLRKFLHDPAAIWPAARKMPNQHLSETEIANLIAFLQWVNNIDTNNWPPQPVGGTGVVTPEQPAQPATVETTAIIPQQVIAGGNQLFRTKGCTMCHVVNGLGGTAGPDLSHIAKKQNEEYLKSWLADPAKMKTGTTMPNPNLTKEEIKSIVDYLETLR